MKSTALSLLVVCGRCCAARGTRAARPRRSSTTSRSRGGIAALADASEATPGARPRALRSPSSRASSTRGPQTGPYSNEPISAGSPRFADAAQRNAAARTTTTRCRSAVGGRLEPGRLPPGGRPRRSGRRDPRRSLGGAPLLRPRGDGRRDAAVLRRPSAAPQPPRRTRAGRRSRPSARACTSATAASSCRAATRRRAAWEAIVGEKLDRPDRFIRAALRGRPRTPRLSLRRAVAPRRADARVALESSMGDPEERPTR